MPHRFCNFKEDHLMKMKKRHQQKLVVLGIVLFFIWNVPFVSIFNGDFQVLGFPAFYVYIFLSFLTETNCIISQSYLILINLASRLCKIISDINI